MTPSYDYATLFKAPSVSAVEATGRPRPTAGGTEAMRRLRHPFAIQPVWATATTEPSHQV